MLIMLSGINSLKTIKEVFRGYTGDRNSKQIYYDKDHISNYSARYILAPEIIKFLEENKILSN